jgi:hypothetical protein
MIKIETISRHMAKNIEKDKTTSLVVLSFSIFLAICLLIVSILIIGCFVFFYIFGPKI